MRIAFFLLLFFPFLGFSQQLPLVFEKKLQVLYSHGSYEKVLQSITKFQDKGSDSPITYKYKGAYRRSFELYNYKFKSELALAQSGNAKMLDEAMLDYSYLLKIASPAQLASDSLIYEDFHLAIQLHAQQAYSNEKWRDAEIHLLYLARVFRDTITEYRKMFEPWYGITQDPTIAQIDSLALSPMKFSPFTGKQLAYYLTKGLEDEYLKARVIFFWIASHITFGNTNDITIYKAKRGVCINFAILYKELATDAGLEAEIVLGIAKGRGYNIAYPEESRHAWNAVRINGKLKLIETTWASCSGKWTYDYYFCADPNSLIKTHFPFDTYFQLLDKEIDFYEFVHGDETTHR